jgi:predicted Ser/Thr protein kinase
VSRRIGPFRIERELGQGGMGVVYLGRHESAGTLAAVKVIKPGAATDPVYRARLRREVAAARSIPRFCTAPVVAADLTADPPYVATEYIDGPTLAQRGRLHGGELDRLAVGVAVALRAIHDHGVVHRDLKPANILLSPLGPRVIDFGIARLDGADTQLTQLGEKLGTVPFMAPEQVGDGPITPAVDVFAWAGVVTFAATGAPPFGADDATPFRILHNEPRLRGLAEPLRELVTAAFHKDPTRRPAAAKLVNWLSRRVPAVTTEVLRTAAAPATAKPAATLHESDVHRTLVVPAPREPAAATRPAATRPAPDPPPQPAGPVRADLTETAVVLSWTPSGSHAGPVRYRVVRAVRPFPASHTGDGGTLVAETTDCLARDPDPPANTPLHYAVVAERGSGPGRVSAPPVSTGTPVWFRPEVTDPQVTPGDRLVAAAWRTPAGAARVEVRRAEGRPPAGPGDGVPVEPSGAGFVDRSLTLGVRYHYLVSVVYLDPDGSAHHTPGVRLSAVPARPPDPVPELRIEPVGTDPEWLRASFPAPGWGTVELWELAAPPEQPVGARLPVAALPGRPLPAVPMPGGLMLAAPAAPAVLLAVTVSGELAAVGAHREWRPLSAPAGLRAQRRGDQVLLTWRWPVDVGTVEVAWRATGPGHPDWRRHRVSVARYRTEGGTTLRPTGGRRYELAVASVVPGSYHELVGPPAVTTIEIPVPGAYTISWPGRAERQVHATVTVGQRVRVPRLLLVVADEWPLSPAAGELLAEARDVELGPGRPRVLRAAAPPRPRPYWLRCFAPGGPVELHDPPRDQLRAG